MSEIGKLGFFKQEVKFFHVFALKMVIFLRSLLSHCSVWQSNPRVGHPLFSLHAPAGPPGTGLCAMLTTKLLLLV